MPADKTPAPASSAPGTTAKPAAPATGALGTLSLTERAILLAGD